MNFIEKIKKGIKINRARARCVLPNTTLAAIVRDEKMNPAGGIKWWAKNVLPYVEEGVIVDTGSVDGTREILEELKSKFPHLRVYNHSWEGFADARNFSLKQVGTKRVLILDADEVIADRGCTQNEIGIFDVKKGYEKLAQHIEQTNSDGYHFHFQILHPNEKESRNCALLNPRIFNIGTRTFQTGYDGRHEHCNVNWINVNLGEVKNIKINLAPIQIYHFVSSHEANKKKQGEWYREGRCLDEQPIENARRNGWKEPNKVWRRKFR